MNLSNENGNSNGNQEELNLTLDRKEFTPQSITIKQNEIDPHLLDEYLSTIGYDLPYEHLEAFCKCLLTPSNALCLSEVFRDEKKLAVVDNKHYRILPAGNNQRINVKEEIVVKLFDSTVPVITLKSSGVDGTFDLIVSLNNHLSEKEKWDLAEQLTRLRAGVPLEGKAVSCRSVEGLYSVDLTSDVSVDFEKRASLESQTIPRIEIAEEQKKQAYLVPYSIRLIGASSDIEAAITSLVNKEETLRFFKCGLFEVMKKSLDDISKTPYNIIDDVFNTENDRSYLTSPVSFLLRHDLSLMSQELYDEIRFWEYGEDGDISVIDPCIPSDPESDEEDDDFGFIEEEGEDSESSMFSIKVLDESLGLVNLNVMDSVASQSDNANSVFEIEWGANIETQQRAWNVIFACAAMLGVTDLKERVDHLPTPKVVDSSMECYIGVEAETFNAQFWFRPVLVQNK